jgi:hypothetical protein
VLAAVSNDEERPSATVAGLGGWYYGGEKVTQYWRRPKGTGDDLQVVVNGRYVYWQSQLPIPGGVAFENFEMHERYREGQRICFGITRKTPAELGFAQ